MINLRRIKPHGLYMDDGPFSEIRTAMIKVFENNNYFEDEYNNCFLDQARMLNKYFKFLLKNPFNVDEVLEITRDTLPEFNTIYYVTSGVRVIRRLKEELDRAHTTA